MDFDLYCCDWTNMDVKSRKLILLIMRIINSTNNRLKIHVTPLKCIGLPVLAAVRLYIISYNSYIRSDKINFVYH